MIVNYQEITPTKIENMRGGEGSVYIQKFNTENFLMARITIPQNASIGKHEHTMDNEYVYVEEGNGECLINDVWVPLSKGASHLNQREHTHSIRNNSFADLVIIAYIYK